MPAPAPPPPYSTDLSLLNAGSPNGAWSLFVFDDEISDAGQILGWGLNLTTVGHLPIPPRISLVRIVNDRPQFTITGQAGDRLVIEGSNDLVNWATISNTVLGADSTVFTDSSISSNIRFYRVGRQP